MREMHATNVMYTISHDGECIRCAALEVFVLAFQVDEEDGVSILVEEFSVDVGGGARSLDVSSGGDDGVRALVILHKLRTNSYDGMYNIRCRRIPSYTLQLALVVSNYVHDHI